MFRVHEMIRVHVVANVCDRRFQGTTILDLKDTIEKVIDLAKALSEEMTLSWEDPPSTISVLDMKTNKVLDCAQQLKDYYAESYSEDNPECWEASISVNMDRL